LTDGFRLRDATPADLPVIADLIRALADYERLTHEIEWTEDELAATLFGLDAVPRVVLAEPTDPPGPAVGLAVLDWNEPSIAFYERQGAQPVAGWTRYRWISSR
jgi:hypothetical protein